MQITVSLRQGHLELFHSAIAFGETVFSAWSAFRCCFEETWRLEPKVLMQAQGQEGARGLPVEVHRDCHSFG